MYGYSFLIIKSVKNYQKSMLMMKKFSILLFVLIQPFHQAMLHNKYNIFMKRLTAEQLRKLMPVFEHQAYLSSQDKKQYLLDLFLVALHKRKITQNLLCMNELIQIVNFLKIPLKTHQMSQLYLYATYQKYQNLADTKKKIMAILNQEKKKVDPKAVAQWIHDKIALREINIFPRKTTQQRAASVDNRHQRTIQKNTDKLPSLIGSSTQKLQQQLKFLIQIFQEMQKERQNSGLIPINDEAQENEVQVPQLNIPYDPELYQLNNKLCKLRIKAQDRLSRIIQLAREDSRIRRKLQEAIERFQKARIEANEKIGRVGAMKAQKRLQQQKQREANKVKYLQLGQNQNLVHASHLYALLTLPEIKSNRLII